MPELIFHILIIGLPALVLLYSAVCAAALRPRTGTLAWITACDRPSPHLLGHPHPAVKKDVLPLAAVCAVTVLLRAAGSMQPFAAFFSQPPAPLAWALLELAGAPLAAAALAYLLMKRLFGQTVSAALCAALVAADFSANPVSLAFSAASLYCLVRYLTVPEDAGFPQAAIPLVGGFVCLAIGCVFDPALLLMLAAAVFLCLVGCADRFIMTGKLWVPSCLAAALLSVTLTWIAVFIPAGLADGYTFPAMLAEGGYDWMALRRLGAGFSALYSGGLAAVSLPDGWPLFLAAFPALLAAAVWLVRDHSRHSLVVFIWSVMQLLTLALLGSNALSLGCAVCLCQVWSKLEENRFLWLAWVGAGALFALLLALHFLFGY